MKKIRLALLCSSLLLLSACNNGSSTSNSSINSSKITVSSVEQGRINPYDIEALKTKFSTFKITPDTSTAATTPTYDVETNCYTINVAAEKSTYVLKGFFDGHIRIVNGNALTSYKRVKLELDGVCLATSSQNPVIEYACSDKNIEIKANNYTNNYIICSDSGDGIRSYSNVVFGGKGTLNLWTEIGHTVKASGKVKAHSAPTINISSGHDGIHCEQFYGYDGTIGEADYEEFTGTINITDTVSQAFDCEEDSFTGLVSLPAGTINVSNAEAVFKTDKVIEIGGKVIASNPTGDPVIKNPDYSGILTITVSGSFTVDGSAYTKTQL